VSFTPEGLRAVLERTLQGVAWPPEGYCVALSGGLDSTVLLAALAGLRDSGAPGGLRAIHVDHGLHPDSTRWSESCARLAARLRVECTIVRVDAGAERALASGRSLLPAGVAAVEGQFERGDAVSVVGPDGRELARGLIAYAADEARLIAGKQSGGIAEVLGYSGRDEIIHRDDLVLMGAGARR